MKNFITNEQPQHGTMVLVSINTIDTILTKVINMEKSMNNHIEKRWLSPEELSAYINYSIHTIYKMVDEDFIDGIHYYKPKNKLMFDKNVIDDWVTDNVAPLSISNNNIDKILQMVNE